MSSVLVSFRHLLIGSPLRRPKYLMFFLGTIGTAVGYTMQGTVAAWLMTNLTHSALMVALVQTATTAPALLLGLIAGSLADSMDRRKVILFTQWIMLFGVAALGIAALLDAIGPISLLVLTFCIGSGFAFYVPAQLASVNELVARTELPKALALSAVAFNSARAIGPALAGAVAAGLNTGSAFVLSAIFFLLMILVVRRWKRVEHSLPGVPERLLAGVRSGLRYARHSEAMRALLLRNFCFSLCASAFWALLPLIARDQLGLGPGGFGLLFAGFGCGAIISATMLPKLIGRKSLVTVASIGVYSWIAAMSVMAIAHSTWVGIAAATVAGFSWVVFLTCLSTGTQTSAPAWVRARAVSMYLVATQAGLAFGSVLWGGIATTAGLAEALWMSAALMFALHVAIKGHDIAVGTEADVTPHTQLPELSLVLEPMPDDGPVLIQIEYCVERENHDAFLQAMEGVGPTRRRSGAFSWRVFQDLEGEERYIEQYVIASWADYVRQRARMTLADRSLQIAATQFQRDGTQLKVSRLLGLNSSRKKQSENNSEIHGQL